jgi:hypothetical protein
MEKKWDTVTPADLEKTLCKREIYVPLVTKGLSGTIFRGKMLLNTKCVLIFCTILSETFLILKRIERDMIEYVHWSSCKVPVIVVGF